MISTGIVAQTMAMRVGLREVIHHLPGLSVAATAARLADLESRDFEVLVAAAPARLDDLDNIQAVLYLTDQPNDVRMLINLKIAAWGAIAMNASEDEISAAIHALAEGFWIGSPSLVGKWFENKQINEVDDQNPGGGELTGRELEVLQLTAQGLANKQIANHLNVSEHTVKFHLSSLYAKLGVTSRTEAVRAGARQGLVVF